MSDTTLTRNPAWQRDELILALDLYFRHNPRKINKHHPEVIKLSEVLNVLPIHQVRPDAIRFRNPNGVYMKLMNFLSLDPDYSGVGLAQGGKLDSDIWNEFSSKRDYLRKIAQRITENVAVQPKNNDVVTETELEEEQEFPEGKVLYRVHKSRERNSALIKRVKERAEREGKLICQVCKFDFYKTYGELGKGFIEVHHTVPVSEYSSNQTTKNSDLALVCPNCHRMLHRRRPWLTIDQVAQILSSNKNDT